MNLPQTHSLSIYLPGRNFSTDEPATDELGKHEFVMDALVTNELATDALQKLLFCK